MAQQIFEYQDVGARYLASRARAGLFDEMGVGKTAQAIRALDIVGAVRCVIICPAAVRAVWLGEFNKFGLMKRTIVKCTSIHDFKAWERGRFEIILLSFEQATKYANAIEAMGEIFDVVVIDEGHYLKNSSANRTKAILGDFSIIQSRSVSGIVKWSQQAWLLTGTPMANDPMDIYTFLRFVDAMPLKEGVFKKRYFSTWQRTYSDMNTIRPDLADELKKLITNNSLRRSKKDVGMQLPPIFLKEITLDGDNTAVLELLAEYPGLSGAIVLALERGSLSFLDAQHISTLRALIAEAKAAPYAALLYEELMNCNDKYVVMANSKKALISVRDYLAKRGIGCVLFNGDTRERDRGPLVEAFQQDDKIRVFLGSKAAWVGLTLTAAPNVDMLESDWTPAGNAQAIMRVHRHGQTRSVQARFITLANSIDVAVNRIVAEKTAAIAAIEGEAMNSHAPIDRELQVA